jgi:uncharacterized protein
MKNRSATESDTPAAAEEDGGCQACGACCAFSADWPRFSLESDAAIDRIPRRLITADGSGMRCEGSRCSALVGEVGRATACSIYEVRPDVCRACVPGGEDCRMARRALGMTSRPPLRGATLESAPRSDKQSGARTLRSREPGAAERW